MIFPVFCQSSNFLLLVFSIFDQATLTMFHSDRAILLFWRQDTSGWKLRNLFTFREYRKFELLCILSDLDKICYGGNNIEWAWNGNGYFLTDPTDQPQPTNYESFHLLVFILILVIFGMWSKNNIDWVWKGFGHFSTDETDQT